MIDLRYSVRRTILADRFMIWDTARNAAVFRAESLTEPQAIGMAHRLNVAYHDFHREPESVPRGWDCVPT